MPRPDGPQFKQAFETPYGAYSELVPISILKGMRGNNLQYDVSELAESLKKEGFRNPGVIQYHQKNRTAILGEGNHRLAAAEQAGFTHMPVWVERMNVEGRGVPVRGIDPVEDYVPGTLRPSQIMDID